MQKRKPLGPSQQNRSESYSAFKYQAPRLIPKGSVVHMRYKTPTETTRDLLAPTLRLGGEGKGPPKEQLSQDLNPKLWAWFNDNCNSYGFTPLHRKGNYINTKGKGRRDLNPPDILPATDHIAYRHRSCFNFNEVRLLGGRRKKTPMPTRQVLHDSDEYFIEALAEHHSLQRFEVLGQGGDDSLHLKVPVSNAMEEDHAVTIDDELSKYCSMEYKGTSDVFTSANDEGEERVLPLYPEIQLQRRERNSKLQRHHYLKVRKEGMIALTSLLASFKLKYVGPPALPIPEYMRDEEYIEREMYLARHKACNITASVDMHPISFLGYDIGNPTPYYHNRLRLSCLPDYKSRADKYDDIFKRMSFRVRQVQRNKDVASYKKRAFKSFTSYFNSLKGVSTAWKFKNVPSIVKFLNYINSLHARPDWDKLAKVAVCSDSSYSKVVDKYGNSLDYATPYADGHVLYQREVDKVRKTAEVITESIIERHFGSLLPNCKWVDNMDLFRSRTKSFTKQIYIEPTDEGSLNNNVILTLDNGGIIQADTAVIKEVVKDLVLYNKLLDQINNTCPSCGKTG